MQVSNRQPIVLLLLINRTRKFSGTNNSRQIKQLVFLLSINKISSTSHLHSQRLFIPSFLLYHLFWGVCSAHTGRWVFMNFCFLSVSHSDKNNCMKTHQRGVTNKLYRKTSRLIIIFALVPMRRYDKIHSHDDERKCNQCIFMFWFYKNINFIFTLV